jgi:hypothetical protein
MSGSEQSESERTPPAWTAALHAAVVFGILSRLSQYAAHTSLWHDEAFVALNVLHKSYASMLGPLDWQEAAPPGFLLLEKCVVELLGRSEYALRLVPLLAGLTGMICFAALARRACSSGAAAFWAVVLVAASDKLIVQSNETKQFTLDLLLAVWLCHLSLYSYHRRRAIAALLTWGAVGACGVWLSFASSFVFAGTSLVLAPRVFRGWRWPERGAYVVANLIALASLGLVSSSITVQRSAGLLSFWASSFPDTSSMAALIYWLGRSLLGLFDYFWQPLGGVLIALAVLGCSRARHQARRLELCVLTVPVLLALIASFLHRWPFGGNQHMVFAGPALLVLVGEGMEGMRGRLTRWRWWAGWATVTLLLAPGIGGAMYHIVVPRQRHEVRPVIEFVQRHRAPGDQLLVQCPAEFEFYTGCDQRSAPAEPNPSARIWFIATRARGGPFPRQDLLDRLSTQRVRLLAIEAYGAAAYLFAPEDPRAVVPQMLPTFPNGRSLCPASGVRFRPPSHSLVVYPQLLAIRPTTFLGVLQE